MLKNYLTTALRLLRRDPLHTAINIGGLAVGLAVCLIILLMIRYEYSFEDWIQEVGDVYQIRWSQKADSGEWYHSESVQAPLARALVDDYGGFVAVARLSTGGGIIRRDGEAFGERIAAVDPEFLDILRLEPVSGAWRLPDRSTILLSETLARKYFGNVDPVGRSLEVSGEGYRVGGVFPDLPETTHFRIEALRRFDETSSPYYEWGSTNVATYARAAPGKDIADFTTAQAAIVDKYFSQYVPEGMSARELVRYTAMPLAELRLRATVRDSVAPRIDHIRTFALVAFLVLVIAGVNFVNLTMARAMLRSREIGLRKVAGAARRHLIAQILGETITFAGFALLLALLLTEIALPAASDILEVRLSLAGLANPEAMAVIVALVLLIGIGAGAWPAIHLSRLNPAPAIRGAVDVCGRLPFRSLLVVAQYGTAIALGIVIAVIWVQTDYARHRDLGFRAEGLIGLRNILSVQEPGFAERLEQEIARLPGVESVTRVFNLPTDTWRSDRDVRLPGREGPEDVSLEINPADYSFLDTFKAKLAAGRPLAEVYGGDTLLTPDGVADGPAVAGDPYVPASAIINQTAARRLGYARPEEALGVVVRMMIGFGQGNADFTVVGVVRDLHYFSARDEVVPTIYYRHEPSLRHMAVRHAPGAGDLVAEGIDRVWRELSPGRPIDRIFVADTYDRLYAPDLRQMRLLGAFAGLAILTASLGLYGLAAFLAGRRTREIALRKVMGARIADILRLMLWQFTWPVLLASLIAWPVALLVVRDWLDGFVYRIALDARPFLLAGGAALAIASLTVAGHAIRVARTHPAMALREE